MNVNQIKKEIIDRYRGTKLEDKVLDFFKKDSVIKAMNKIEKETLKYEEEKNKAFKKAMNEQNNRAIEEANKAIKNKNGNSALKELLGG